MSSKKNRPCEAVHPSGHKCWKKQHDSDEQHMTCIGASNGKLEKVYWYAT